MARKARTWSPEQIAARLEQVNRNAPVLSNGQRATYTLESWVSYLQARASELRIAAKTPRGQREGAYKALDRVLGELSNLSVTNS